MAIFFSIMAGCFAVIQSGLNKMISQHWGFSAALLLNGIVFLLFNLVLFSLVWLQPKLFSGEYLLQGQLSQFRLWWILPGLCGFLLVMGLAVSMSKIGAVQTFVICIAAQIACSLLWDIAIDNKPASTVRLVGALVTFIGAILATR